MFLQTIATFIPTTEDLMKLYITDVVDKTAKNISPLYRLDSFDYTVLILYFSILGILAIYGGYRIKQVIDFWRYRNLGPEPKAHFQDEDLPHITAACLAVTNSVSRLA